MAKIKTAYGSHFSVRNNKCVYSIIIVAMLGLVTSCAKSPSSIAPTAVNSSEYDHLNCQQLATELSLTDSRLNDASARQNNAQAMDAVGVFLILIPVSALAGDSEGEVAQRKGEQLALRRAIEKKNC